MSNPPGVAVGQGIGITAAFSVLNGALQHTYPAGCSETASAGMLVKPTATEGEVELADTGDTFVAGLLGQDTVDLSAIPARVAENIYAQGILEWSEIGQPASVHKIGIFRVTAVHGTVAYGDYLKPYNEGLLQTNTTTNAITNGSIVCLEGNNGVANDPITVSVNLA